MYENTTGLSIFKIVHVHVCRGGGECSRGGREKRRERLNKSEIMFTYWSEFGAEHKIHSSYLEKNGI